MATAMLDPRIQRTRSVVLQAAFEVVAERGFAGATIDAVAQRCGVARSTIYRHWPDRMDLLLEAVATQVGSVDDLATGDLRSDLIAIGFRLASLLSAEPIGSVAASLILESRRDPLLERLRERFIGERRAAASAVIRAAIDRGELDASIDPGAMANDLAAQIFFRAMVLRAPVEEDWVVAHVDRWLDRYGIHPEHKE